MGRGVSSIVLGAAILSMPWTVHALECDPDGLGVVEGWVETTNISETLQVGQVNFHITGRDGVVFDGTGAIVGEIKSTALDGTPPTVFLDHTMVFPRGQRVETTGDEAALLYPTGFEDDGTPCAFAVTESITQLSGNKLFRHATVDVTAVGTISSCSDDNANRFTLSGEICLR
jgi:hypothetical protein